MLRRSLGCPPQNVVQYTGSKADREVIREHEFHWAGTRGKRRDLKFDVLLVCALAPLAASLPDIPCLSVIAVACMTLLFFIGA